MIKLTRFIFLISLFIILGCTNNSMSDHSKFSVRLSEKNIRWIPFVDISEENGKKYLSTSYAIDIAVDSLDYSMQLFLDNYTCKIFRDSNFQQYDFIVLRFLKETEATISIKNRGITDTNNPYSSEHFYFAQYLWDYKEFSSVVYNENWETLKENLPCLYYK